MIGKIIDRVDEVISRLVGEWFVAGRRVSFVISNIRRVIELNFDSSSMIFRYFGEKKFRCEI